MILMDVDGREDEKDDVDGSDSDGEDTVENSLLLIVSSLRGIDSPVGELGAL